MVKEIMKDLLFLGRKAEAATKEDRAIAEDLLDTLRAHRDHCVGMAANMIGEQKAIIAIVEGNRLTAMLNPEVVKKSPKTYKTVEAWQKLLREKMPADTSRVLDLGCGPAFFSIILAKMGL